METKQSLHGTQTVLKPNAIKAYYARYQNLADDRLCKVIFNKLRNSENSEYHTYFKNLFIDLGLDHYVQSAIDIALSVHEGIDGFPTKLQKQG
jgi:hypothetical protein